MNATTTQTRANRYLVTTWIDHEFYAVDSDLCLTQEMSTAQRFTRTAAYKMVRKSRNWAYNVVHEDDILV